MIERIDLINQGTINKNKIVIETKHGVFCLYFSYQTLVGIDYCFSNDEKSSGGNFTRQNDWSTTTGKLLNELEPDKKKRLTQEEFDNQLNLMFDLLNK